MMETIVFGIGAAGLVVSSLAVVLAKNPLRAALYLIAGLCSAAVLFVLLEASFVAAMQVLVYAGAIMVLFVFVIMLLNLGPDDGSKPAYLSIAKLLGSVSVLYVGYRMAAAAIDLPGPAAKAIDPSFGSVKSVGVLLLTDFLFGFEAISVLLLVAVVGAVVLGLKRLT